VTRDASCRTWPYDRIEERGEVMELSSCAASLALDALYENWPDE
jgi:hypothetical protein